MSTLKILSFDAVAKLLSRLKNQAEIVSIYESNECYPNIEEFDFLNTAIRLADSTPLLLDGGSKSDAENAIAIYNFLGPLKRTAAADKRLWTTLCHTVFWEYNQTRWPVTNQGNKVGYIEEHWFEKAGGGLGALRRNAISRLWWAAYLTVAPWEQSKDLEIFQSPDRFKFTKVLLSQAQIFQDVIERKFGSNLRLRICLLDSLDRLLPEVSNKDDLSKLASKRLNLILKNQPIDSLAIEDMLPVVQRCVENAALELQA